MKKIRGRTRHNNAYVEPAPDHGTAPNRIKAIKGTHISRLMGVLYSYNFSEIRGRAKNIWILLIKPMPMIYKNQISKVLLIFALTYPLNSMAQPPPEEACSHLRGMMDEINRQAPVKVDFITDLIGGSVIFISGKCNVVFIKVVDESRFIETIINKEKNEYGVTLNKETIIDWLNSKEGRLRIKQLFLANQSPDTMRIARLPHMNFANKITFDKQNVHPLVINLKPD